jgi:PBP1b-binding outer membrane lipoprotein LpoB
MEKIILGTVLLLAIFLLGCSGNQENAESIEIPEEDSNTLADNFE